MQDSNSPVKFSVVWGATAASGFITTPIPATSADPTRASLNLGFPPDTATPIGAGGTPPNVKDINGGLNMTSAWAQWQAAGGPIYYDSAFSSAISGYPKGAMLSNASTVGSFWVSTVDNNTSDPDTGGANWTAVVLTGLVPNTRQVIAGTGLNGGGALSANVTLNVVYGTTAGTAAQGNDSRIVNAAQLNLANTFTQSQTIQYGVNGAVAALLKNTTSGTSAQAAFQAANSSNNGLTLGMTSVGYTTLNGITADTGYMVSSGSNGLTLGTTSSSNINFITATNLCASLATNGLFQLVNGGSGSSWPAGFRLFRNAVGTWTMTADNTTNEFLIELNSSPMFIIDTSGSGEFAANLAVSSGLEVGAPTGGMLGAGQVNVSNGYFVNNVNILTTAAAAAAALAGRMLSFTVYSSHGSATYNTPAGTTTLEVYGCGAGASGAGAAVGAAAHVPNCGSGGGSGSKSGAYISSPLSSYAVVTGTGGAAVTGAVNGNNGGASSFGSVLNLGGGLAGVNGNNPGTGFQGDSVPGGAGGTVTSGGTIFSMAGQPGNPGICANRGFSSGGNGGVGPFGGGGGLGGNVTSDSDGSSNGGDANGNGAGGGGAAVYSNANSHSATSGKGGDGYMSVKAYT